VIKKQYFSLQWKGKQYQKGWKPFSTKKHIEMQKSIIGMAQKTENQPLLHQFYTIFRTTHEHIFCITVFGISYRFHICQISSNNFRDFVKNANHALYAQTASEADRSRLTT